jgi:signal transduction histidine kinase
MACVPIVGPGGIEALLYTASRITEAPGDVALGALARVATYAELALHHLAAREHELELELLRERQRLAIELHDSVAQTLFAIGVAARYSRRHHDRDALLATLEEIETTAADARRELRETLQHLASRGEGIGFEARLEGEIRLFERTFGCNVRITRHGEPRELPEPVERLILDTLIEGLRNAVKHAAAKLAVAHLRYSPGEVILAVHAPSPPQLSAPTRSWRGADTGVGLTLIERRATQLRGTLRSETAPGGDRVLRLELPTVPATGRA